MSASEISTDRPRVALRGDHIILAKHLLSIPMFASGVLKLVMAKGTEEAKATIFLGEGPWKLPSSSSFLSGGLTRVHVDEMIEEVSRRDACWEPCTPLSWK